jgi:hypothetical protein
MMSAIVMTSLTASMSRRMVICDKRRDMGKPPRCGKMWIDKTNFVLRQSIKTKGCS